MGFTLLLILLSARAGEEALTGNRERARGNSEGIGGGFKPSPMQAALRQGLVSQGLGKLLPETNHSVPPFPVPYSLFPFLVIEGLDAGADDYLIKPFSAQELVSRVNGHLQMAQLRLEALYQERTLNRRKDELLSTVSHELNTPLVAILGWTRLLRANPPSPSETN